jgi:hypothetical protein
MSGAQRNRPIYETPSDRSNECVVVEAIKQARGYDSIIMPPLAGVDLFCFDANLFPRGWIEIKSRKISFGTYENLTVSLAKIRRLLVLQDTTKIPSFLIANLSDGIFIHGIPNSIDQIQTTVGGRTDRGDAADIETMAIFDWHNFRGLA